MLDKADMRLGQRTCMLCRAASQFRLLKAFFALTNSTPSVSVFSKIVCKACMEASHPELCLAHCCGKPAVAICLGHIKDCLPSDSADGLTYYSDEVYSWVFIERNQLAGYKGYKSRWIDHCSADMPGQGG